jgi:putative iron-dependent peroxidase
MASEQRGIGEPVPRVARYLWLQLQPGGDPTVALKRLVSRDLGDTAVVGLGPAVVSRMGRHIAGFREFPAFAGSGISVPSTPAAIWIWLRGDDRGVLLHEGRELVADLANAFTLDATVDAFRYAEGRDLTGYEDGTENPSGDRAREVAFVSGAGPGLDGSSFVAVQRFVHDLERFSAMPPAEQDRAVGRRKSDNVELEDAPASAHVKRTAQEDFDPQAFVLRRSMPWTEGAAAGLVFVAFGRSLDAFEAQLRRMLGLDDGITDALFRFTRPVTGSYFWCPPVRNGKLDLSIFGL